jgi:lysophospholipase L1-like esterase
MILALVVLVAGSVAPAQSDEKAPQLVPKRLSSMGDSISVAINAEEFSLFSVVNPNPWASWVNGYQGFWEWLLGRTDVNSHNQRITRNFGSRDRRNYMEAQSGADSFDLANQAQQSVDHKATYVTMLMGHNDVCQDNFAHIPTDAEFALNIRAGLDRLREGLPAGATVYVLGIVDVKKLWELGENLTWLGILDCRLLWNTSLLGLFPCATMLSPDNSEADREYTRSRIEAFNSILEALVAEYDTDDPAHHYHFSNMPFDTEFTTSDVSSYDCFHPSARGQKKLSELTWGDGPFSAYTK